MNSVATVVGVSGSARAVRADGSFIELMPGSQLSASDTVSTGANSSVCILFQDDAEISLGADTTIAIKEFSFDSSGATPPAFWIDMAAGVVRSVSGKVVEQNPEAFKLSSPLGVAGIRGTTTIHEIHEGFEIHTVVELGQGHIVVITAHDGRSAVLTNSLELVRLKLDSVEPLLPESVPGDLLREYLEQLTSLDLMRDGSHEALFAMGGLDTLRWLGSLPFVGRLGYLRGVLSGPKPILDRGDEDIFVWKLSDLPGNPGVGLHLYGTDGNDRLIGSDYGDWMHGYKGDDYIYAGLGRDTVFGGYGSFDTITKPGVMTEGSYLYGDEAVLNAGAIGDDDIIRVTAESGKGPGNMTGGTIYGDAAWLYDALGGDDTISVAGTMSGGVIYGDAGRLGNAAHWQGGSAGDDAISVSAMTGGAVFGDAADLGEFCTGGDDTIHAGVMSGGVIYGDAEYMGSSNLSVTPVPGYKSVEGGDDEIRVDVMNGGVIYGDAETVNSYGLPGNDTIHVGVMNGGVIYGDALEGAGTRYTGGDSISIDHFNGGSVYTGMGDGGTASNLHLSNNTVNIGSVGGAGEKNIHGSNGQVDDFQFSGSVHTDGAEVHIYDFIKSEDWLSLGFAQGNTSFASRDGNTYVTCTDAATLNEMTIILHGLASHDSINLDYF